MIDFKNLSAAEKLSIFIAVAPIAVSTIIGGVFALVTKCLEVSFSQPVDMPVPKQQETKVAVDTPVPRPQETKAAVDTPVPKQQETKVAVDTPVPKQQKTKVAVDTPVPKQQKTKNEPETVRTDTNGSANQPVGRPMVTAKKDRVVSEIIEKGKTIELKCGVYSKANPLPLGDNEEMASYARRDVRICLAKAEEILKLSGVIKEHETNELVRSNAGLFGALQQAKRINEFKYLLDFYGR